MQFDVVEAIRQKQQKEQKCVSIENGKTVVISIIDGTVVVSPEIPQGLGPEEGIETSEIVHLDG